MQYANHLMYTDVVPFEVVRTINTKTLEVRAMSATLLNGFNSGAPDALTFSQGGFCGHTSGTQRWDIQPDPNERLVRIRLHKDGLWRDADGGRYKLADRPIKHYDYNF